MLGYVPDPPIDGGQHLVQLLFQLGPAKGEMWLTELDLEGWERRRGIELEPWQAELIVEMSQAYLGEMHAARSFSALCPWPKARNAWGHVCAEKMKNQKAEAAKKEKPDGSSQRRRNPPPG